MISIDTDKGLVIVDEYPNFKTYDIGSVEAFEILAKLWLRAGWDTKYIYSFTWLGRPIIQFPEDMFRLQEVIYQVKPDVIIETGIAHGGSFVFYAGLCKAMGRGRVISIDIEIRPHNRKAIEEHELYKYGTFIEANSINEATVARVKSLVSPRDKVFVVLDSCHTKAHVLAELNAYSDLVSVGSYIVACDGIMGDLVGAPRSNPDWGTNNPKCAVEEFIKTNRKFVIDEPVFRFNEGQITKRVTYWPLAFLKRIK